MTDTQTAPAGAKVPIWFWIVAVLLTLWNAFGVMNYVMAQMMPDALMASMNEAQQAYYLATPAWAIGIWATAVFAAFIGAAALFFRAGWAFYLVVLSVVLYAIQTLHTFAFRDAASVMGFGNVVLTAFIFAVLLAQFWFTYWAGKRGILR